MPKIRINKYSDFFSPKDNIRFACYFPQMFCKINFSLSQLSHYLLFGNAPFRAYILHIFLSLFLCEIIHY